MTFERFAALNGLVWHAAQPWQIAAWLKTVAGETPEYRAAELEKVSHAFDSVGLPDPTRSELVTNVMSANWKLREPRWTAEEIAHWRKLPYRTAKIIADRAEHDLRAVRRLQRVDAYLRKHTNKGEALLEIEKEMKANATNPTTKA
jgi:hypothetical protein